MNILQVMGCTSDQYSSMEIYLVKKAAILKRRGHSFYVVYENIPKRREFRDDFKKNGGEVFSLKLNGIFSVNFFKGISKIIRERKIDLIHTYFTPTCHFLNFYLRVIGFKCVVRTAANLPLLKRSKKKRNAYLRTWLSIRHRFLSSLVRKIICRSEGVKDEYTKLGVSSQKLVVIPGGVEIEKFIFSKAARDAKRREYGLDDDVLALGASSRLVPVKRIDFLIKVFKGLRQKYEDIRLLIAGDGPQCKCLVQLTEDLGLGDSVIFLGHQNEISDFYSALDIFCLPSLAEGMSNSLLEAMSTRLPVIASDIPSNREVVDEGKGGHLISFKEESEFERAVKNLRDRETRKKMGEYNREKVVKRFTLDSRIHKELEVYEEVFERSR